MLMYLHKYNCDITEEIGAIRWEMIQQEHINAGKHLTVLPWNSKRPVKIGYHFSVAPEGFYRIAEEAPDEKFFDFVVYDHPTLKTGYVLDLRKSEFQGGGKLCDPLPPAPIDAIRELAVVSASAQALMYLAANPDKTHEEVAFIFGLTRAAVSMALKRERERLKYAEGT